MIFLVRLRIIQDLNLLVTKLGKIRVKILTSKTRRIRKPLKDFFDKHALTDAEKDFILGCMLAQSRYPQLTHRQWQIVNDIKDRYDGKIPGSEEIT